MKLFASILALTLCHASATEFPKLYNSEPGDPPMSASEAVAKMQLPPGFKATVFAAEPDVQNPIALAWDARGRLWVAENYTYAEAGEKFDRSLRDRILIFEDTNGDGHFDSRKVFTDEVQMLTSIEVVPGGVYVMCPPQLLFIPDRNRDDVPDGAPEVLLDGFVGNPDLHHTFANGLRIGPDGWLYGRCGASSPGEMGVPGTPPEQRIPLRGTMWRYHPQRKVVEAIASGTTNPWGHDWDAMGELFFINTVNGHLWHQFDGAHYMRPHTFDPNPRVYALLDQHADHWHFDTAKGWAGQRNGLANDLGGGHAHIGMMIYQGDNWPKEYRGHLFTLNLHGRRANQELLERQGSGYVGKHGKDFFTSADPWFRGMEITSGPDGGVYVSDWSDTGECHDSSGVHRTSGRIYKITYGDPKQREIRDVHQLTTPELVQLHTHSNVWFSRQARLELIARGRDVAAEKDLHALFEKNPDVAIKLRALWTLYGLGALDESFLRAQLNHPNEHVRVWAIRLLTDDWPLDTILSKRPSQDKAIPAEKLRAFNHLAQSDSSGLVRLALASTLQRIPPRERIELATALVSHAEDAADHNLPLLIWYGLIPAADVDPIGLSHLAAVSKLPLTRKLIARRLAEDIEKNPEPLNSLLKIASKSPAHFQQSILDGMAEALTGWRKASKPEGWDAFAAVAPKSPALLDLGVLFGDGRAIDEVKKVALNKEAELVSRKAAVQTIIDSGAPETRSICEQLLGEQFINAVAARGVAKFDDPAAAEKLVRAYRAFHTNERPQLMSVLVSRPTFASALLDAVAERRIPRADISVFHARQIRSFNNPELNRKLTAAWGELRDLAGDKKEAIARWKSKLKRDDLAKADVSNGRVVFNMACAACHTLYGEGGKVGPDLTGGGRENIDYLLENIVDPSSVVPADFRMSVVDLKDGRTFNALIPARTERTLTLKTMTETLTLERSDVASITESTASIMPEGLLDAMTPEQARDLIAYLMFKAQVPLR